VTHSGPGSSRAQRCGISDRAEVIAAMDKALAAISGEAAGG
jgi:hypothetical protein